MNCMKKIVILIFLMASTLGAHAQNYAELQAALVKDWERAKLYTQEYLATMPADKYGFKVVDSIRSFGEQLLHLTQGTIGLIANATGADRIFVGRNLEKSVPHNQKDSVEFYVNAGYDFAIKSIKNMDASKLMEEVKRGSFTETRLSWILKAFEHQTHHRGQVTIYIRQLGIRPPQERLF